MINLGLEGGGLVVTVDDEGDVAEGRYLQTWSRLNLTMGGGYFRGRQHFALSLSDRAFAPVEFEVEHTNAYAYAGVAVATNLIVLGGVGVDAFNRGELTRRQVNPKVGITWNLSARTTLRAAAFRVLRRSLIANQTIEPSHVMGFSQFYDDVDATKSRRYGVALDHAFSGKIYAGGEWSGRHLEIPTYSAVTGDVTDDDATERLGRSYLYVAAARYLAIATEYQIERLQLNPFGANEGQLARSTTHTVSTAVRIFHPSGWTGQSRLAYVRQNGLFGEFDVSPGADRFALLDLLAGYRIPGRRGIVTVEIRNVLNTPFTYQDSAPQTPRLLPRRSATVRLTLSL